MSFYLLAIAPKIPFLSVSLKSAVFHTHTLTLLFPPSLICQIPNLILNILPNATLHFRAPIYLWDMYLCQRHSLLFSNSLLLWDILIYGVHTCQRYWFLRHLFFSSDTPTHTFTYPTFDLPVPQSRLSPLNQLPVNVRCSIVQEMKNVERWHFGGWWKGLTETWTHQ